MTCKRIGVLLMVVTACAANAAAQHAESSDARLARLERLVGQLQAQVDELKKERNPAPSASAVAVNQAASTETHQSETPTVPPSLQTGPIRWGGEFRLYFDSLTRPESAAAPPAANTRGRYLLHLNMNAAIHRTLGVHVSLSTGAYNNPLTDIQDFGGGTSKHPISISEAYADYRPNRYVTIQGGRVDSPFNDRLRFLFDTDTRFNGTNETIVVPLRAKPFGITSIRFDAGQYFFTNPNVPVVGPGVPSTAANATPSQVLLAGGAEPGQAAPASGLFQQGIALDQQLSDRISQRVGADLALYRDPNQLQLLSTPGGLFLAATSIGFSPSSPFPSLGNGTTTPTGGQFTAPDFHIMHVDYALEHRGLSVAGHSVPAAFNLQFARNLGADFEKNALVISASAGQSTPRRARVAYAFYRKEANSLIGQVTENDIAVGSSVNMAAHFIRLEYGAARNTVLAGNVALTTFLSPSDPSRNFFVPLGPDVPRQRRVQLMLISRF